MFIPLLIESQYLIENAKLDVIKSFTAKIKIKYWIIGCLYNRNLKWGWWYTNKWLMEDNELIRR